MAAKQQVQNFADKSQPQGLTAPLPQLLQQSQQIGYWIQYRMLAYYYPSHIGPGWAVWDSASDLWQLCRRFPDCEDVDRIRRAVLRSQHQSPCLIQHPGLRNQDPDPWMHCFACSWRPLLENKGTDYEYGA